MAAQTIAMMTNTPNGSIHRLKGVAHEYLVEAKTFCQANEDYVANEKEAKTPEYESMSESGQVLSGDAFQVAPLRDNLEQHILDSLPYSVEAVLLLPQTHEAEEDKQPLRK